VIAPVDPLSNTLGEAATVIDLPTLFPFPLDPFQLEAIDALNQGHSVVVSAPTGSGKTLVGEYAIHRALAHGQKVFYTTPLKALSNQKLRDFREQFGAERVGLLTGDMSLNREAQVVVMTTEIFRNMLYAEIDHPDDDPLAGVEAVVLDECHYMNDSQRGTVWEESIIHCPPAIQLVALSATVANAAQLTDWIERVHGPTRLVHSDHRPVPLAFSFCSAKGLHPLLNEAGTDLHPNAKVWRAPKGNRRKGPKVPKPPQPEAPPLAFVVAQMAERDMLPAIYFIFSRRGCDKGVRDLGKLCLVSPDEQVRIQARMEAFVAASPEAVREGHAEPLLRGIASHHAGVLPAWKELIEDLFQQGLIKVVFATETLAAGINMPARTTVISALSKRTERGHRPLMGSEFLQMAGRAGRRGLDTQGYVVTVQSRFEGVREAGQLATAPADPLVSQFTPSYGMVLNLLQRYSLAKAKELVERSFGRYLATLDLADDQARIAELQQQLDALQSGSDAEVPWDDLEDYEKRRGRLREERRLLRTLQHQAEETLAHELTLALQFASEGTLVSLKAPALRGRVTPAVIVAKVPGPGQFPLLLCLTDANLWILVPCSAVVSLHAELSCLQVSQIETPDLQRLGEHHHGTEASAGLALAVASMARRYDMATPQYDLAGEVQAQAQLVQQLDEELELHPAHRRGDRRQLRKQHRRIEELSAELEELQRLLHFRSNRHWDTFLALIEVLRHFGGLAGAEGLEPSEVGRTVAALRGDNELWLGLALMSGHLDGLDPAELAAVLEAISTEVNRPDLWCGWAPPPAVEEALHDLRSIRRQLDRQQERARVLFPLWWEPELTGLVDAWARGCSWSEVIANTSLDEGDVVRVLRRTVDLLAQIPYCEAVSQQLRDNARRALKAINRFPVCDLEDLAPPPADPLPTPPAFASPHSDLP
jgi:superfamily II RNA helicase